jgi:hypothetical protein
MKGHGTTWLVLGAILAVAVFSWLVMPVKEEARYEGRTVKEWFLAISTDSRGYGRLSIKANDPAIYEITAIGSNAVPFLMGEYRLRKSRVQDAIDEFANRWLRLGILTENDRSFRIRVCLELLGQKAESAVPELIEMAGDIRRLDACERVRLLGKIHARPEITIPALERFLKSSDVSIRNAAIFALREFGPEAKHAVPALITVFHASTNASQLKGALAMAILNIDPKANLNTGWVPDGPIIVSPNLEAAAPMNR